MLWPDFKAFGGVNIRSARVDKDLVASGAVLEAGEGYALLAAGARIGGAVLLNAWMSDNGPISFTAQGDISFLDATVLGSVEIRGGSVDCLFAINAHIGGAALLCAWEGSVEIVPFAASGDVPFKAARISGDLDMTGSRVKRVNAPNVQIGGGALLRACNSVPASLPCAVTEDLSLASAKIAGNLDLSGATLRNLSAENAEIGGSAYLTAWIGKEADLRFAASGDVSLASAKITGNLDASGASMQRLTADNARIAGAAFLRARVSERSVMALVVQEKVSLMGCNIAGNLEMTGASLGDLFAANAQIGGAALLSTWHASKTLRFNASGPVSLPGVRIGGNLEMMGASLDSLNAQHADVGGAALLRAGNYGDSTQPFEASGVVSLTRAKVGGNLEMTGASLDKLDAQNADIGGSALLRAWNGVGGTQPFSAKSELFLLGAKIRADLDFSGAKFEGPVRANYVDVGGNVWLSEWSGRPLTFSGLADFSGSKIRNSLIVQRLSVIPNHVVTVDLSHSVVEVFDDENGTAWGQAAFMKLEGFCYSRLGVSRSGLRPPAATERLSWLSRQYPGPDHKPNMKDFTPDAYDRLARGFRAAGYYRDARTIVRERLRVERRVSGLSFSRPFLALYAAMFDSGLSPARAIATFLGFIVIGWGGTIIADRGSQWLDIPPVLVRETSTVKSLLIPAADEGERFYPGMLIGSPTTTAVRELLCTDEIEPFLYALDVFVPALEVHQESRCCITTSASGFVWRIARAAYGILGWIVTALTVLTVSGVARRHLEE